jgi:hypothetical protein
MVRRRRHEIGYIKVESLISIEYYAALRNGGIRAVKLDGDFLGSLIPDAVLPAAEEREVCLALPAVEAVLAPIKFPTKIPTKF